MAGIFRVHVSNLGHEPHDIVLVKPLRIAAQRQKEKELGLLRLIPTFTPQFIFAESIIRGAHIIPDWSDTLPAISFVLNDVIDEDMFLCIRDAFPSYTSGIAMDFPIPQESETPASDLSDENQSDGEDNEDMYERLFLSDSEV